MKVFLAAVACSAAAFLLPVRAQTADTASMTCADLTKLDKQARDDLLGAENQMSGASGMEAQDLEVLETELHDYCAAYPEASASLAVGKITSE